MTHALGTCTQGGGGARRTPKRPRRRSGEPSTRETLSARNLQRSSNEQAERENQFLAVRTRSAAAVQYHLQQQQQQPMQGRETYQVQLQRRSTRRPRQLHHRMSPNESPTICESCERANAPSVSPSVREFHGELSTHSARAPTDEENVARASRRHRWRREDASASHDFRSKEHDYVATVAPLGASCALVLPENSLGDARHPPASRNNGPEKCQCSWSLIEDKEQQLLQLLSWARAAILEPLCDIGSLGQHVSHSTHNRPSTSPGASEEPIVWHKGPQGELSSLQVLTGAASLSHKHMAALSQEAAGAPPTHLLSHAYKLPQIARWVSS